MESVVKHSIENKDYHQVEFLLLIIEFRRDKFICSFSLKAITAVLCVYLGDHLDAVPR